MSRIGPAVWAQAATHARSPLSWRARVLAAVIATHADPASMTSQASLGALAAWTDLSRSTVNRGRQELRAQGWLLIAMSRTIAGDLDDARLLMHLPTAVDNPPGVVSLRHHPLTRIERGGGV